MISGKNETTQVHKEMKKVVITGGAGFIGTNMADRLARMGVDVLLFDNLSRAGSDKNLEWILHTHKGRVKFMHADIRDPNAIRTAITDASVIYHFAGQVAVTTSIEDPVGDFETNMHGTFLLLEAIRTYGKCSIPLFYTSTNKVYGQLGDIALKPNHTRYIPISERIKSGGIDESRPLDFHSPYGCSKGAADQYITDYARTFDIPAVVFRMSCIYGPHQFGNEDQGWVANFLIRALNRIPIHIYGDGLQVRDILYVEDLVDAFLVAYEKINKTAGHVFNIGGGPERTVSIGECVEWIRKIHGALPEISHGEWRKGDQKYFVANTNKMTKITGWKPTMSVGNGIRNLYEWLVQNRHDRTGTIYEKEKVA